MPPGAALRRGRHWWRCKARGRKRRPENRIVRAESFARFSRTGRCHLHVISDNRNIDTGVVTRSSPMHRCLS
jgi:hypothetical protein